MTSDIPFFPLSDSLDHQIIMHCEAHFSGNFSEMVSYYKEHGKGAQNDFSLKQIQKLQKLAESSSGKMTDLLEEEEKEHLEKAKKKYKLLQDAYSEKGTEISKLIADLIFSEEEDPQEEISALVHHHDKSNVCLALIQLLQSEEFYDPLFPGYAKAPKHAATCLGLLQEEKAIIPLFQVLGKHDFETDEEILSSLYKIGDKAQSFLIKQLTKTLLSKDNENAALCLLQFEEAPSLPAIFLEMLENPQAANYETFLQYLIIGCMHLTDLNQRKKFAELSENPAFPKMIRDEMKHQTTLWVKKR